MVGTVIFTIATVAAEPFEVEAAVDVYQAVDDNSALFRFLALLATVGLLTTLAGMWSIGPVVPRRTKGIWRAAMVVYAIAMLLWVVQAALRMTLTVSEAANVAGGAAVPDSFPQNVGVGVDVVFLLFMIAVVPPIAALPYLLFSAGLISRTLVPVGILAAVAGTVVGGLFYEYAGAVERMVFWSYALVVLPAGAWLLFRGRRVKAGDSAAT